MSAGGDYAEIALRLVLAGVSGALIGIERQRKHHPAGLRTHTLVSLGSCLIMLMSEDVARRWGPAVADPGRIAAQVVSGIGFLGAGTIIREGVNIRGLTTAASLWVASALGLAMGGGYYLGAVFATALAIFTLAVLSYFERGLLARGLAFRFHLLLEDSPQALGQVMGTLSARGVTVREAEVHRSEEGVLEVEVHVFLPGDRKPEDCLQALLALPGVASARAEISG